MEKKEPNYTLKVTIPLRIGEESQHELSGDQQKLAYLLDIILRLADLAFSGFICGDADVEMVER
jgi:hypothetical protein